MALAFYRKYRPKKLEELVGQSTNVEILKNAARKEKMAHAYLFYGPRGTGKTTTARLVAKLLNCEERIANKKFAETGEPCGTCATCLEIDDGSGLDLIEIDAASNRGIDEIRNLKDTIELVPVKNKYKIYIIDEAHMLTGPAFNALLKTLEEPPAHAVMILATTEYEKIPATIASRAQRFLFKKLPKIAIAEKLSAIAQAENIRIEPPALELLAASGEGSLRDAISLLDQVSSHSVTVDLPTAERLVGRVGLKKLETVAELILKRDAENTIAALASYAEEGYNLVQFTKDLIHYLRKILTLTVNPALRDFYAADFTEEEIGKLGRLSTIASAGAQTEILKRLLRAYGEMRYSPLAVVPLEIALVELSKNENTP